MTTRSSSFRRRRRGAAASSRDAVLTAANVLGGCFDMLAEIEDGAGLGDAFDIAYTRAKARKRAVKAVK